MVFQNIIVASLEDLVVVRKILLFCYHYRITTRINVAKRKNELYLYNTKPVISEPATMIIYHCLSLGRERDIIPKYANTIHCRTT
jgi:hypothetical protein